MMTILLAVGTALAADAFTLAEVQTVVSPDFGRVKLTGLGSISPRPASDSEARLRLSWFTQSAFDLPLAETGAPFAWAIARGGPLLVLSESGRLTFRQALQLGANWNVLANQVSPTVAGVTTGQAYGRVTWLAVNALTLNPRDGGSVFYYYEGCVTMRPVETASVQAGAFWENINGFQAGPRLELDGFFIHVGVVGTPLVALGFNKAW